MGGRFITFYTGGSCLVAKSCPNLVTPWIVPCQAPLSMGFPRQEYWKWVVISSSGSSGPGVEPVVYRQIICHWAPGKPRCWGNGNRKSVVLPCRTVESSCGGRRRHTFVVEVDGYWRRGGKGSGILFPPQAHGPPCVCSLLSKVTGMCKSLDNTV